MVIYITLVNPWSESDNAYNFGCQGCSNNRRKMDDVEKRDVVVQVRWSGRLTATNICNTAALGRDTWDIRVWVSVIVVCRPKARKNLFWTRMVKEEKWSVFVENFIGYRVNAIRCRGIIVVRNIGKMVK